MLKTEIEKPSSEPAGPDTDVFYDRTGPGTPCGRFLRQFWTPVALLNDVQPGRSKRVRIMDEQFTYYRGKSGTPHVLANECVHRHSALAPHGIVEDDCIRCFYHGWKYDATGQCVDQPAEGTRSFAQKVRIKAYPVREELGIVFAFLGIGDPPPFQQIDVFYGSGVCNTSTYERKTNFFNAVENQADWLHVYFVHGRGAFTNVDRNAIPVVTAEETDYGLVGYLEHADGTVAKQYVLMPTSMYINIYAPSPEGGDGRPIPVYYFGWRVPIDDHSYRSFNLTYADVTGEAAKRYIEAQQAKRETSKSQPSSLSVMEALERGDLHIDDVDVDHPDLVGIQDSITMENQRSVSEREPDRLGHSDAGVIVLRKIYRRELRKLMNDEELKAWHWPRDLEVVGGF